MNNRQKLTELITGITEDGQYEDAPDPCWLAECIAAEGLLMTDLPNSVKRIHDHLTKQIKKCGDSDAITVRAVASAYQDARRMIEREYPDLKGTPNDPL